MQQSLDHLLGVWLKHLICCRYVSQNTVEGRIAFFPAVGRLNCDSTYIDHQGFWQMDGFGLLGVYKSDWIRFGGTYITKKKYTLKLLSLLSHTVLSTLLILAVCRMHVTTNLARHESPSSSVVRTSDRCYGRSWARGHEVRNFFFVPRSWQTEYSIFLISFRG